MKFGNLILLEAKAWNGKIEEETLISLSFPNLERKAASVAHEILINLSIQW